MDTTSDYQVVLKEKPVDIYLSKSAHQALSHRETPLAVVLELYFSCLIRKSVRFHEDGNGDYSQVSDKLKVMFRPVMTQRCSIHEHDGAPPVTDFPIQKESRFVPRWIKVDYRKGEWHGDFGFV